MYHLVEPSKDQAYGCFFRWEQLNYRDKGLDVPQPLGMQYFNRPGCQSAFALDMTRLGNLNNCAEVERIYFRHDKEANQLVYDLCQQGRMFFPEDGMEELVGKLKCVKSFSEEAVERCRVKHYGDKTFEEMREMMAISGMDIIDKPAVGFEKEQIEKETILLSDRNHGSKHKERHNEKDTGNSISKPIHQKSIVRMMSIHRLTLYREYRNRLNGFLHKPVIHRRILIRPLYVLIAERR